MVKFAMVSLHQLTDAYDKASLVYESGRVTWYRPTDLATLLQLKHTHPHARLVIGNTEIGEQHFVL